WATTSSGYDSVGGGMLLLNAGPTVRGCIVEDCLSASAGGIYLNVGTPLFEDCEIRDNWGYNYNGGGLYQAAGHATLLRCSILRNRGSNASQGAGGGLYISGGAVTAQGCVFANNLANEYYGVFYGAIGGGVFLGSDGSTFEECRFLANRSHNGGGAGCYGNADFINCVFSGNTVYSVDNGSGSVGGYGGAMMVWLNDVNLIGCSIAGNDATEECGGMYVGYGSRVSVENSVLWANTDGGSTELLKRNFKKETNVSVSLLWSGLEGLADTGNGGCIALAPRFVDLDGVDGVLGTVDDDLRLGVGSPCIDAGNNTRFTGVVLDLDGAVRHVDDPSIWDRGRGTAPIGDMGTYEFTSHGPLLALSVLQRGQPAVFTISAAEPFEVVNFFISFAGAGAGPAYPQYGGMALDLRNPVRAVGSSLADVGGTAVFTRLLPPAVALRTVTIQAAIARGLGGANSVRTQPVSAPILP
ncbi:MAG: right-handed parallel beta-helix repeat-containing protein, partial [Planctomycetota bacterium]